MKKFVSSLLASAMIATSLTAVSSSAVGISSEIENSLSVSKTVLTSDLTADNGSVIPAGTVSISVSISNNSGFDSTMTKLELGDSYDVIVDKDSKPVINTGSAMGNSSVSSAENNNTVAVVSSSSIKNENDGLLFTLFANENNGDTDITVTDMEFSSIDESDSVTSISPYSSYYIIGDVNNDGRVNASDSSSVRNALYRCGKNRLTFLEVKSNLNEHFPKAVHYRCSDIWKDVDDDESNLSKTYLTTSAAEEILDYYAAISSGGDTSELSSFTGEKVYY